VSPRRVKRKTTPGRRLFTCLLVIGSDPNATNPACLFLAPSVAARKPKGNLNLADDSSSQTYFRAVLQNMHTQARDRQIGNKLILLMFFVYSSAVNA
jgi:hypothetical protein